MRISDWSSDVCSSDLRDGHSPRLHDAADDGEGGRHQAGFTYADDHSRDEQLTKRPGEAAGHRRQRPHRYTPENNGARRIAELGRASWRERVCQYVTISVVAVSLKKQKKKDKK